MCLLLKHMWCHLALVVPQANSHTDTIDIRIYPHRAAAAAAASALTLGQCLWMGMTLTVNPLPFPSANASSSIKSIYAITSGNAHVDADARCGYAISIGTSIACRSKLVQPPKKKKWTVTTTTCTPRANGRNSLCSLSHRQLYHHYASQLQPPPPSRVT